MRRTPNEANPFSSCFTSVVAAIATAAAASCTARPGACTARPGRPGPNRQHVGQLGSVRLVTWIMGGVKGVAAPSIRRIRAPGRPADTRRRPAGFWQQGIRVPVAVLAAPPPPPPTQWRLGHRNVMLQEEATAGSWPRNSYNEGTAAAEMVAARQRDGPGGDGAGGAGSGGRRPDAAGPTVTSRGAWRVGGNAVAVME
jgi:hypothetical protein